MTQVFPLPAGFSFEPDEDESGFLQSPLNSLTKPRPAPIAERSRAFTVLFAESSSAPLIPATSIVQDAEPSS